MSVSPRIIEQRIRNRLMEWLDAAVSGEADGDDLHSLVNQWNDWVFDKPVVEQFGAPVYTAAEVQALAEVRRRMDAFIWQTPQSLDHRHWRLWRDVAAAATAAFECFAQRGRLPEEIQE